MHSEFFKQHVLPTKPTYYRVTPGMVSNIDVWLEPVQVWEVLAADLSISPAHLAGVGIVRDGTLTFAVALIAVSHARV